MTSYKDPNIPFRNAYVFHGKNLLCLTWRISLIMFVPVIENFILIKSLKLSLV